MGKVARGTIKIEFRQGENMVDVVVSDDGAGLNIDRIVDKDVSLASQNIDSVASAIFRNGFSTASKVTEISGRGVGMDAVKSIVDGLGGRISVETGDGIGSLNRQQYGKETVPLKFAITLPRDQVMVHPRERDSG